MIIDAGYLKFKNIYVLLRYAHLPLMAKLAAKKASGLLFLDFRHYSLCESIVLSVWENQEALKEYRNSFGHKYAMKRTFRITDDIFRATWTAETLPCWDEVEKFISMKIPKEKLQRTKLRPILSTQFRK